MTIAIEKDGVEEWTISLAPQCLTDILVQVRKVNAAGDAEDFADFTFEICNLLREEIEDRGDIEGLLQVSDMEVLVFERWASQLETMAIDIRTSLKSRRISK